MKGRTFNYMKTSDHNKCNSATVGNSKNWVFEMLPAVAGTVNQVDTL